MHTCPISIVGIAGMLLLFSAAYGQNVQERPETKYGVSAQIFAMPFNFPQTSVAFTVRKGKHFFSLGSGLFLKANADPKDKPEEFRYEYLFSSFPQRLLIFSSYRFTPFPNPAGAEVYFHAHLDYMRIHVVGLQGGVIYYGFPKNRLTTIPGFGINYPLSSQFNLFLETGIGYSFSGKPGGSQFRSGTKWMFSLGCDFSGKKKSQI